MMHEVTITEAEYNNLKASHQMLGAVGCYLEDFCNDEETVLVGVMRLLAQYHRMKSDEMYDKLEKLEVGEE